MFCFPTLHQHDTVESESVRMLIVCYHILRREGGRVKLWMAELDVFLQISLSIARMSAMGTTVRPFTSVYHNMPPQVSTRSKCLAAELTCM